MDIIKCYNILQVFEMTVNKSMSALCPLSIDLLLF